MIKKTLGLLVVALALGFGLYVVSAQASTVTGDLNTGLNSNSGNMDGIVIAAPTVSPAAGTYTSAQSVTLSAAGSTKICYTIDGTTPTCTNATTCGVGTAYSSAITVSSSKTIKSLACYNNDSAGPVASSAYTINISSGGGGGGGGGGSVAAACTALTYNAWQSACFNGVQYRTALTQTPAGCALTTAQQLTLQRACETTTTSTPPVVTPGPTTPAGDTVLENIMSEAEIVSTNDTGVLLNHLGNFANQEGEQNGLTKYKTILGLDKKISAEEKLTINDFIVYGTRGTQRLGAGERAAVINSYFQAYGKLPNTEAEWSDVLKIASGRWPTERSAAAEAQAKIEFKKVYARNAVMTNNIDENAIMVIAYGLLPLQRNLNSEKVAIKTFAWVYGHNPVSALAWNIVRAIAYSGAKR
jgi:hypothetical protein